jgi:hypothetical protein
VRPVGAEQSLDLRDRTRPPAGTARQLAARVRAVHETGDEAVIAERDLDERPSRAYS